MKIKGISAIIVVSKDPESLKAFYERVFGLSFTKESHDQLDEHFFVVIGNLRLIIHHSSSYRNSNPTSGAITFYFSVDSLDDLVTRLSNNNVTILKRVKETFGERIEFRDLDSNLICATCLSRS